MTFPALDRVVTWASAYIRPAQPPIPGVIPSTLAADLAAVVARCEVVDIVRARLIEIQHKDRWCICPFSVTDYPHMNGCPLGIAAELLALLPADAREEP